MIDDRRPVMCEPIVIRWQTGGSLAVGMMRVTIDGRMWWVDGGRRLMMVGGAVMAMADGFMVDAMVECVLMLVMMRGQCRRVDM